MASVDSGVETSNESNDSGVAHEQRSIEISPIKIPRGVNVMTKACGLGDSDKEEKNFNFVLPEISEIEPPAGLSFCNLQPGFGKYEIVGNAPAADENRSWNVETHLDKFNLVIRHGRVKRRRFDYHFHGGNYIDERKLRVAVSTNNEEQVAALLESDVNPNCCDRLRRTPLHLASCRGYFNVVRMLLEKGANPNKKDSLGNTPLHLAVCTNHVEVVTLLLKAGTNINSSDHYGRNPLQLAQSKLKLLHKSCSNNEDSMRIKQEGQKVIEMMLTFLHKKGQDSEAELLNAFQTRFTISQTKEEVESDVLDLLSSLNNLNLNKSDG